MKKRKPYSPHDRVLLGDDRETTTSSQITASQYLFITKKMRNPPDDLWNLSRAEADILVEREKDRRETNKARWKKTRKR